MIQFSHLSFKHKIPILLTCYKRKKRRRRRSKYAIRKLGKALDLHKENYTDKKWSINAGCRDCLRIFQHLEFFSFPSKKVLET